jgi:hypothetical protein
MKMIRFLYEKSVSYKGHLIIPFVFVLAGGQHIYSYALLSDSGHKGRFHKAENPAGIYSDSLDGIVEIAKEHLYRHCPAAGAGDNFKSRYTYRDNLIIVCQLAGKFFYDHYKPDSLTNVAAPKLFTTESECLNWIKQGLDGSPTDSLPQTQ